VDVAAEPRTVEPTDALAAERPRFRSSLTAHGPLLVLGAIMAAATGLTAYYGLRAHMVQPDEFLAVIYGRSIEARPSVLFEYSSWPRGPERLTALLFGIVAWLVPGSARAFQVSHILFAFCFALTALPVYLLGRTARLGRWWALLPATLSVVGPWSVFGISLLNTGLGYLTTALLLVAMLRALLRPGWSSDALVLAAVAGVALARTGDIPFIFALVPAVVVQVWRDRPAGQSVSQWLRTLPATVVRRHPLLSALAVVGIIVAAVAGSHRFTGSGYQTPIVRHFTLSGLSNDALDIFGHLATGTLMVPLIIAVPWLAREAAVPRGREEGAFAVLAVGVVAAFVYFYAGRNEDRYIMMLAPVVFIPFVGALACRQVPLVATLVSGALVGRLVVTRALFADDGSYGFFVSPGSQFLRRVVLGRASGVIPFGEHAGTYMAVGAVALALVLTTAWRLPRSVGRTTVALGLVGLLAVATAAAFYTPHRLLMLASPKVSFAQQAFVDEAAGNRPVGILDENPGSDLGRVQTWGELSYFNRSLKGTVQPDGRFTLACCSPYYFPPIRARLDRRTGTVRTDRPMYDLLVVPTGYASFGFNTTTVARSPAFPFRLERFASGPPRLAYSVEGATGDGWGVPGHALRVRTFPRSIGGASACLVVTIAAPPDLPHDLRFTVRGASGRASGRLTAALGQTLSVPLADRTNDVIRIASSRTGRTLDGRRVTLALSDVSVIHCG
jgi:hypothetical protein